MFMKREKGIWYDHIPAEKWTEEYPDMSLFAQLKENSQRYPDLPAMVFQNKKYTFRQMIASVEKLASSLIGYGIKKGDFVSIVSPNIPQATIMFYAVNRIGAVANMIYPLLSSDEIQQFVERTNSKAVFIPDVVYSRIANIRWNLPKQPKVIIAKIQDALPFYLKPLYALKNGKPLALNPEHDIIFWNDLLSYSEKTSAVLPADEGKADDLAVILYTGGTTGTQKGAMSSNFNYTSYTVQVFEACGVNCVGKRCLAVIPLFHGFGLAFNVHAMLANGACLYLVPTFDLKKCFKLIFGKKLNFIFGVPAFFEALTRCPEMDTADLSFIESLVSGGDVLRDKLQVRINSQLKKNGSKTEIRNAYGLTESLTGCCINPLFKNVIGSVGLPCPDNHAKIVAPGTVDEVPIGTDGELCLSGPVIMRGYYNDPEATAQVLKTHPDGKLWLHTGDIFCQDEEGYLYFRQRSKRIAINSGFNIYLSQVEDVVAKCSIVKDCCAVAIRDAAVGQYVGLYIILKEDIDESRAGETILEYCKKNLAAYAMPHEIRFVKEFPQTIMGKTDFKVLEEQINQK